MQIREFVKENGSSPFRKWFQKLDAQAAAEIRVAIARLELGNTANIKWFSGIGEYKINWGAGYRIYLVQDGVELIILFGGGTKKTQKSDIAKAKKLYEKYKARKKTNKSQ
ncbi:MAG: type II toxin-antitoxin system RelE/ParE family toxin [Limnothrix sp.]